ncbi:hypothetical protein LCGC14_1702910, partial [marine sediment metagenome]
FQAEQSLVQNTRQYYLQQDAQRLAASRLQRAGQRIGRTATSGRDRIVRSPLTQNIQQGAAPAEVAGYQPPVQGEGTGFVAGGDTRFETGPEGVSGFRQITDVSGQKQLIPMAQDEMQTRGGFVSGEPDQQLTKELAQKHAFVQSLGLPEDQTQALMLGAEQLDMNQLRNAAQSMAGRAATEARSVRGEAGRAHRAQLNAVDDALDHLRRQLPDKEDYQRIMTAYLADLTPAQRQWRLQEAQLRKERRELMRQQTNRQKVELLQTQTTNPDGPSRNALPAGWGVEEIR